MYVNLAKAIALCAFSWTVTLSVLSQELLKPGPFGRPVMVMDEAGNWSMPISVYSDPDLELFVPDITAPGWIQWHAAQFRQTGTYLVYLFSQYKNDKICRHDRIPPGHGADPKWLESCAALRYQRRLISVDTRNKTVTTLETILMESDAGYNPQNQIVRKLTVPLSSAVSPLPLAYSRITEIVAHGVSEYKGPTAQEIMDNNRKVAARTARQVMTPDNQQGCPNATAEQLRNWHNTGCPPSTSPAPVAH